MPKTGRGEGGKKEPELLFGFYGFGWGILIFGSVTYTGTCQDGAMIHEKFIYFETRFR